jgi:secreted trypsin-like serine protease
LPIHTSPAASVHVYVGSHNFEGGRRVAVKNIIRHAYDAKTKDNDLALLELSDELEPKDDLSVIQPANQAGANAIVVGWGSVQRGVIPKSLRKLAENLQYAVVQFKENRDCNRYYVEERRTRLAAVLKTQGKSAHEIRRTLDEWYPSTSQQVTENMFCAGTNDGSQDGCFGDSGGPLVIRRGNGFAQVGIVSWGPSQGCGLTNLFGVYVKLERYADWISAHTQ